MNLKILILVTLVTSSQLVYAEKHLLILGGGGEPVGKKTIFDDNLSVLGLSLKNLQWNYDISFNGGHSITEDIIKNNFSKSVSPPTNFNSKNYEKMIEGYKLKINRGQIKAGDQLVIFIESHGGERIEGQQSHSVASSGVVTNLDSLEGSDSIDLDSLKEIIELTNKKGIKLGVVDMSCHSGTTLALKKNAPNTCIVSATGPDHYSFGGKDSFGLLFFKKIKTGLSMEEVFLNARVESEDNGYPMISTSENNKIVEDVYAFITPYLYYDDVFANKFSQYIFKNGSVSQFCKRNEDMEKLISKIDDLNAIATTVMGTIYAESLKYQLINYKRSQDVVLETSIKLNSLMFDKSEVFMIPPEAKFLFPGEDKLEFTWKELMVIDCDAVIDGYEADLKVASSNEEKREVQLMLNMIKVVNSKKKEILKKNPQFSSYIKQTELLIKQINASYSVVNGIARSEKFFYDKQYRSIQKPNSSDPCKSIIF